MKEKSLHSRKIGNNFGVLWNEYFIVHQMLVNDNRFNFFDILNFYIFYRNFMKFNIQIALDDVIKYI